MEKLATQVFRKLLLFLQIIEDLFQNILFKDNFAIMVRTGRFNIVEELY